VKGIKNIQPRSRRPSRVLISNARWGWVRCDKAQLEVVNDAIDHKDIRKEGNDAHLDMMEAVFILRQEPVKIMEEHAVENGALWMSRAVDSCHGKDRNSKNEPIA